MAASEDHSAQCVERDWVKTGLEINNRSTDTQCPRLGNVRQSAIFGLLVVAVRRKERVRRPCFRRKVPME